LVGNLSEDELRISLSHRGRARKAQQAGFTLIEMMLACAVLMVGIVSVVQLVPASLKTSVNNRLDTMATVVAQRELDQMLAQPLNGPPTFQDTDGHTVSLGGAGAPGANVVMDGPYATIDFSSDVSSVPDGFSAIYVDLNDLSPNRASFELRWAVFSETNGAKVIGRRIIIGCRRTNSNTGVFPVTLDSVQKF
jgi:prepilin-type N-terminal cleavage/methylation domain-containing protein